jgi:hypothetical protein
VKNLVWEWMQKNGLVKGDVSTDRQTFIALNFLGDIDPMEIPLPGELEEELPEHLQLHNIMGGEDTE